MFQDQEMFNLIIKKLIGVNLNMRQKIHNNQN